MVRFYDKSTSPAFATNLKFSALTSLEHALSGDHLSGWYFLERILNLRVISRLVAFSPTSNVRLASSSVKLRMEKSNIGLGGSLEFFDVGGVVGGGERDALGGISNAGESEGLGVSLLRVRG